MENTRQETKVTIKDLIETLIESENYFKTRVFIIANDDFILKINELKKISFLEMKELEKYELVKWSTDWTIDRNDEIKTLVIIGR